MKFCGVFLCMLLLATALASCGGANVLLDVNQSLENRNWGYHQAVRGAVAVTDSAQPYHINFKLRHTASYPYANIYVLLRLKGPGLNKLTRYQFKLANDNGQWLGKGSGNLYTYAFPLLKAFRFPKKGKYSISVEQNMRNNPLPHISDIGLLVATDN